MSNQKVQNRKRKTVVKGENVKSEIHHRRYAQLEYKDSKARGILDSALSEQQNSREISANEFLAPNGAKKPGESPKAC